MPSLPRALAALTLLGAVLRIFQLNSDLWLDEVVSLTTYFRLSPLDVWTVYKSPNQHVLYSFLASLCRAVLGESAWAVRLPAALAGIASIPAFFYLSRTVLPARDSLIATALLTVSYHHIWFSQSARGYAGMMLAAILGTAILLANRQSPRRWHWPAYALAMAAGMLFLQNTLFVVLGHLAATLIADRRLPRPQLLATAAAGALAFAGHIPLLPAMLEFWRTEDRVGFGSGIASLPAFFKLIGPVLFVPAAIAGLGAWRLWQANRCAALAFTLPAVFGALAVVALQYGAYPRAFLYCLPFGILFAVEGTRLYFKGAIPILLLVASIASLFFLYRHPKQDYTGALAWVEQHRQPGDLIAGAGMAGGVYDLYYRPGLPVLKTIAELQALEAKNPRVWVLFSFTRDMRLRYSPLYDYLEANYTILETRPGTLGDGAIYIVFPNRTRTALPFFNRTSPPPITL